MVLCKVNGETLVPLRSNRFLQYLKDCFCELLLVNCPDPTGKKVYLADIAIKDSIIYQICNFSRRKYVHTFPTVEYWMSIIPLAPIVHNLVARFCCSVIPGFFDNLKLPQQTAVSGVKVSSVQSGVAWTRSLNLRQVAAAGALRVTQAANSSKQVVTQTLQRQPAGNDGAQQPVFIVQNSTPQDAARIVDQKGGQVVSQRAVGPLQSIVEVLKSAIQPLQVQPGDQVQLVTDPKGNLVGYSKVQRAQVQVVAEQPAPPADRQAVGKTDLEAIQKKLDQRDEAFNKLGADLANLQKSHEEAVRDLHAQLAEMRRARPQ